jgi:hypothetical protein
MYRFDTFSGRQRTGIVRRDQRSKGHFANDQDDLRRLKAALTATHVSIAGGTSPNDFAENEVGVFKTLASERMQQPETVAKAKNFLSVLFRVRQCEADVRRDAALPLQRERYRGLLR